jgi:HD-like signal output (HDOD) protein
MQKIQLDGLRILIRRKDIGEHVHDCARSVACLLQAGASPREVADEIALHPELTLRVIKLASCAAFANPTVHSVLHAVELLGFEELSQLLTTLAFCGFLELSDNGPYDRLRYRQRCLLIGFLTKSIAEAKGLHHGDVPFTAGLLQESGFVAIERFFPDGFQMSAQAIGKTPGTSICEIEQYYLGVTHSLVGAMVAEEYHLDEVVIDSLRYHHDPASATSAHQEYVDIAHVAGWLADALGMTAFGVPADDDNVDPFALKRLGYCREKLDPLVNMAMCASAQMAHVLA